MNKQEIIFFDELGFGWVVDKTIIKMINIGHASDNLILEKSLSDLLRQA